jgi:hypothetical protein
MILYNNSYWIFFKNKKKYWILEGDNNRRDRKTRRKSLNTIWENIKFIQKYIYYWRIILIRFKYFKLSKRKFKLWNWYNAKRGLSNTSLTE